MHISAVIFEEHIELEDRRFYMMKFRSWLYIIFGLLIFGFVLFIVTLQNEESEQIFPATINRDCAPWDGAAFTVRMPLNDEDVIDISIWQAPDIKFSKTFSFPDNTGQVGNASLIDPAGSYEQLTGEVWFKGVSEGQTVAGGFRLKSERGEVFEGRFAAAWEGQIALCG